ncbi:metalloregulator ArsR/SmtB family transcription factor [Paenibacillus sp. M1]|uniref:Metalloregulator ArsR/SmtB family transcription factor n=1 Tax=Paenibacillus haidiansis TaxID=1574488 RepID=A0ABU7VRZ6_9BACL
MKPSITPLISLPMEFLYSLYALGTDKGFVEMIRAFGLEPSAEMTDMLQKMKKPLSRYIEQETTYFFDAGGLGFILYKYIVHNPALNKVNEIIELVQKDDSDKFLSKIMDSVCKNTLPAKESPEYKAIFGDRAKLLQLVNETKFQDESRKTRVIETVQNPEEIKQRFALLLGRFYAAAFEPVEAEILKSIDTAKSKYDAILKETPELFMSRYLNTDSLKNHPAGYILHLSLFKYVSCHAYSSYQDHVKDWFVLGIYTDQLFNESALAERQAHFFKVLSDVNRISMIRLLSERPWFGQELAEALNISPPTVSYHIGFLQQIGAVSFKRIDNRIYYELDRDKLLKPLQDYLKSF